MDCSPPGSSVHGILQAKILGHGLPCPPPGDLPHPGTEPTSPVSPALQARFFTTEPPGKLIYHTIHLLIYIYLFIFISLLLILGEHTEKQFI